MPRRAVPALSMLAMLRVLAAPAFASDAVVRLGDASVRYDDARWKVSASGNALAFEPLGEDMRRVDPVSLGIADTSEPCETIAQRVFPAEHYDTRQLLPVSASLGGVDGVRLSAHTRCRNATPVGVAICVRVGGRAYVLQSVQAGCRGRNLFSGIDPLQEIAGGISFAGRER